MTDMPLYWLPWMPTSSPSCSMRAARVVSLLCIRTDQYMTFAFHLSKMSTHKSGCITLASFRGHTYICVVNGSYLHLLPCLSFPPLLRPSLVGSIRKWKCAARMCPFGPYAPGATVSTSMFPHLSAANVPRSAYDVWAYPPFVLACHHWKRAYGTGAPLGVRIEMRARKGGKSTRDA